MTTEDPSSTDSSTISLSEWTMLPELALDNGSYENEDAGGDENKNASENEERNEDKTTERGTTMEEKADIIEKNKATMHPFTVSTNARESLISEKLSENSTLIKVTTKGGIM